LTERDSRRLLFLILGVAVALRFWGLNFGLPNIYHTDEWFEVQRALKLGAGVIDLERVGKGFYYYLLFVLFGAWYAIQRVLGNLAGSSDFLVSIFRDPSAIWLIGRSTTAIVGTLNVWLVYRLGLAMRGRAVGLLAAAALAIHWLHVNSSHYITVDVPLTFLLTLGFALIYRWQEAETLRTRHYVVLALVTAAATATKLPGAVFVVAVLLMHVGRARRAGGTLWSVLSDRRLLAFLVTGAVVYAAVEPGIVYAFGDILRSLLGYFIPPGGTDAVTISYPVAPERRDMMVWFYASALFPPAYTVLPLLFVGGAVIAIRRDGLLRHTALVFAAIYALFLLSSQSSHLIYERYLLPLIPIVGLYASLALVETHRLLSQRHGLGKLVAPILGLVVAIPMLAHSVRHDINYVRPDTRTAAKEFIEQEIPAGESIYLAGSIVQASAMTAQLKMMPEHVDERVSRRLDATGESMSEDKSTYYDLYKKALAEYRPTYDLIFLSDAELLARAVEDDRGGWALMLDANRSLFDHEINRETFPGQWALWQKVDSGEFEVVQRFTGTGGMVGPSLTLYRRVGRFPEVP
jgi:hypothetical protein